MTIEIFVDKKRPIINRYIKGESCTFSVSCSGQYIILISPEMLARFGDSDEKNVTFGYDRDTKEFHIKISNEYYSYHIGPGAGQWGRTSAKAAIKYFNLTEITGRYAAVWNPEDKSWKINLGK